ncbi:23S rRNA (adenine(2503)-C(2))-methyltransferase RlmN [Enterobacteriaceae bacterium ET-AT1-13]|nr:23S rRNA (adenine(2503)-C(2))-methyltransferase RlmN [Enterobacteriaceae bacterium ET-AT1-13]WGS66519.1 23S rRNA (adenine(2503)-C(2))-methyltransferase RlmN [Enterobacteriaceae bacterium Cmel17]WMC17543.1 MAG: 23S rRNA (adenine(2503)-C(2))-methyltransferase RlmN [Enterobacteriaceae bacterium Cmel21]WMC17750.1 MAG: 23S rRNA (adenine(2503)-C(2))-methyltransferase RlmN [Enterobacteriaceae bacterium PSmelAO3-2]WMC17954.1 MAG: 23S rRNA (adenine(2503)-C(2))-methyltransferase RlmN [Enterobacteriace
MLFKIGFNIIIKKINLLSINYQKIFFLSILLGEKSFRAKQIIKYVYSFYSDNLNLIKNINIKTFKKFQKIIFIRTLNIYKIQYSYDGTIKFIMEINKKKIETIYIPEKKRFTLCISSQIGCFVGCDFCFTSKQGFNRNLYTSEIISQIWNVFKFIIKKKINFITNIVIMGMGEPLLNFSNIVSSILIMRDKYCFNFSKRVITLSTVGIVPALDKLKNFVDIKLALSLHASNDKIRNIIIPFNKKYNIKSILKSAKKYIKNSKANKNGVTIEYVMLDGINDKYKYAYQLAFLLKNISCKINLIPWNKFLKSKYKCSSIKRINNFSKILLKFGFIVTIRKNRGIDINAACGQLSGEIFNNTNFLL